MNTLQHLAGSALSALCKVGAEGPDRRTQVLMYHSIGGSAAGDSRGLYSLKPSSFREQMTTLKTIVSESNLKIVPFGQFGPGSLSITFDDGYKDNLSTVVPIMAELDLPFHIFLCPTFIDSKAPEFLSRHDVAALYKLKNVTLGVHGYSHNPLTSLRPDRAQSELRSSREWLEDIIGEPVSTMSYPHGAFNDHVRQLVDNAGFSIAASSKFGPIQPSTDLLAIPRIDVWSTDTTRSLRTKISGQWDWMKWRT